MFPSVLFLFAVFLEPARTFSADNPSVPQQRAHYHNTDALLATIRSIAATCPHAYPQWIISRSSPVEAVFRTSSSSQRSRLFTVTITRNARMYARAKRLHSSLRKSVRVVAVFGEHARELVTTELALAILRHYCTSSANPPRNAYLVIVPLVNEAGRRKVEAGFPCERLNSRLVDLNRNYLHEWGRSDANTILSEESPGKAPLSEFESRAIDALVQRVQPTAYVSVHSGDRAVLIPWDSGSSAGAWVRQVAIAVRDLHCPSCPVGTAQTVFGYRAFGTGVDHMFGVRQVPFACTVEVYGGEPDGNCTSMFNPLTRRELEGVFRNWSGLLDTVTSLLNNTENDHSRPHLVRPHASVAFAEDGEQRIASVPAHLEVVFLLSFVSLVALAAQRGARRVFRQADDLQRQRKVVRCFSAPSGESFKSSIGNATQLGDKVV